MEKWEIKRGSPIKPRWASAAISPSRWWSCCSLGRAAERRSRSWSWTSPPGAPRPRWCPEPPASSGSLASCWGSRGSRASPCLPVTGLCQQWYLGQGQGRVELLAAPAIICLPSERGWSSEQVKGGSGSEWQLQPLYSLASTRMCAGEWECASHLVLLSVNSKLKLAREQVREEGKKIWLSEL